MTLSFIWSSSSLKAIAPTSPSVNIVRIGRNVATSALMSVGAFLIMVIRKCLMDRSWRMKCVKLWLW